MPSIPTISSYQAKSKQRYRFLSRKSGVPWRIIIVLVVLITLLTSFFVIGLRNDVVVTRYRLNLANINTPIRIAVVSDTHSCVFGEGQQEIANILKTERPDAILLAGDIIDDDLPFQQGFDTVSKLPEIAPTFYVTGNHEFWSGQVDYIKEEMMALGIQVLAGDATTIDIHGQALSVAGLDDPEVGNDFTNQVARLGSSSSNNPRVLISHRPELVDLYASMDTDVIVAGHAHGGQWRIPVFLEQGVFAPDQGVLPSLTGGVHELAGGQQLVISRGLARESTRVPRFYNPPEVVLIDIEATD